MKTGKYYFSHLSDDEQEKFKANTINLTLAGSGEERFKRVIMNDHPSFNFFITIAFVWEKSPEGMGFWSKISLRNID